MKGNSTCVLLKKLCDMDIMDPFGIAKCGSKHSANPTVEACLNPSPTVKSENPEGLKNRSTFRADS